LFNDQLGPVPAGTFNPAGLYTPSDRRLKHDIRALESTMEKIMRLDPVRYRLNYLATGEPQIGFIAQEVHMLFPELVGEIQARTGEKYQSVNYAGFGVLAIKAIQEQQTEIESLKKENHSLQENLLRLEQRLTKLEATDNR
ncbi:MAG: tail fiber domain-containing protein, partial [Saprospiraceae bacterium]